MKYYGTKDGTELSHDENGNPQIIVRVISDEEKKNHKKQVKFS